MFDPKVPRDQKRGRNNSQRGGGGNRGGHQQRNPRHQGGAAQTVPAMADQSAASSDPAIAAGEAMLAPDTQLTTMSSATEGENARQGTMQQQQQRDRKRPRMACKYWMQGKCNKGERCPFSHDDEVRVTLRSS